MWLNRSAVYVFMSPQFIDKRAPCRCTCAQRPAVFAACLLDVASPTKCLKAIHVERVLPWPATQRRDVIALKPPGLAAHDTSPAVALEDGPAHGGPAASIQVGVV